MVPRKKKDTERQTISFDRRLHDWIQEYADEHGIDFTAAVNLLLTDQRRAVERREDEEEENG